MGPDGNCPGNPRADVAYRPTPEVPEVGPEALVRASGLVARLPAAKMAAEHPEPPKGELQLPPPPPPGHYGAWAAQELQAKLAEIGLPSRVRSMGSQGQESARMDPAGSGASGYPETRGRGLEAGRGGLTWAGWPARPDLPR